MEPEQMRAARATLNWSLDRLAKASGVHRNTLSNFETRKYKGEPDKIAAARRALEKAGARFTNAGGETTGAGLKRFQVGDLVRFRPQTRVRFDFGVASDEIGTVVGVEQDPPQTGPTYRIQVQFERALVPYTFRFEYELVQAASSAETLSTEGNNKANASDSKRVLEEFCAICDQIWMDHELYRSVCETDQRNIQLYHDIAPLFFGDIARILIEHQFLQFAKITDPAETMGAANLTTNYILQELPWPQDIKKKLQEANKRLMAFRQYIKPARNKRVAHINLAAQTTQIADLGNFPKGADEQFLKHLQTFVDIAYQNLYGTPRLINAAMSTDTHKLIRALVKSRFFDQCSKCDASERAVAVLDFEGR